MKVAPYTFDEFFAVGMEESVSPFLTTSSKKWGKSIPLKASLLALILFFIALFIPAPTSYLFLSTAYFLVGPLALQNTVKDLKNLEININVLTAISAFLALVLHSPFEGALLLILFELSSTLEQAVSRRAKSAVHNLHKLEPKKAQVIFDGKIIEKALSDVEIGNHILIKGGEVIPLDGKVIEGSSSLNLSHLTGESRPVSVKVGAEVSAGALNLEGKLIVQVTRSRRDSALERIISLISQAQEGKPNLQRTIDRFSQRYALLIICLTGIFALFLPLFWAMPYLGKEGSIYRALSFMIAASPCALILATPTAYLSAISSCAKKGVIIKGGVTLDALSSCTSIAFDKTGTLTKGNLTLSEIKPLLGNTSNEEALLWAEALERNSTHPIAKAISKAAVSSKTYEILDFITLPGIGVEGKTPTGKTIFLGSFSHLLEKLPQNKREQIQNKQVTKGISSFLLIGEDVIAFYFIDDIRDEAKAVVQELKELNLRPLIFTGDSRVNGEIVAKEVGIDDLFAELKPQDKLKLVASFAKGSPVTSGPATGSSDTRGAVINATTMNAHATSKSATGSITKKSSARGDQAIGGYSSGGHTTGDHAIGGIAMVGDGINDAPALARATVGISMGKIGSATANDASDVILLHDDLKLLKWLFVKAHKTVAIVKENLILALSVILCASLPALLGLVPLWIAVCLHEGGTLLVGLNSLRLLKSN